MEADGDEIRFLEQGELDGLAAAMPEDYRAMVYVAGVFGLPSSEVVGLRVGRIDFLKRTVSVVETMAEVSGKVVPTPVKTKASRRTIKAPPSSSRCSQRTWPLQVGPTLARWCSRGATAGRSRPPTSGNECGCPPWAQRGSPA